MARPTLRDRLRRVLSTSEHGVRLAEARDAAAISRLLQTLAAQEWDVTPEDLAASVEGALARPDNVMFVLRDDTDGAAKGMAVIHVLPALAEGGRQIYIDDLVVTPEAWEQGLGGRLMRAIVGIGEAIDASLIFLHARPSNAEAKRLYESAGFKAVDDVVYQLED
ncbi:MAG TPA: GNAT family N-acetyltransferase [bacterium]|nr:GNAT family N-acetyltransferase [bacterium]